MFFIHAHLIPPFFRDVAESGNVCRSEIRKLMVCEKNGYQCLFYLTYSLYPFSYLFLVELRLLARPSRFATCAIIFYFFCLGRVILI